MKTKYFFENKIYIFSYDKVSFYGDILRFKESVQLFIEKNAKNGKPKQVPT